MENLEQSVSDVSEESSPSPESQSSSHVPAESAPAASPQENKVETPFHEHPRFKELINQRNEFSQRLQDYEKRFQELNSKLEQNSPKAPTPESKLLDRLKGVDPEFGSWAEQQHNMKLQLEQKLAAMEQWKTSQEQQTQRSQISSSLEKLHTEHKVPSAVRDLYEAQLERFAKANPQLTLNDLPSVYKNIHDSFSKYLESVKRDTLASYSKDKTKDATLPASPKGVSPKPGGPKFEYSKDPQEARSQIVKNALKSLRNN